MSADHLEVVKVSVDSCSFSDTNIVSESGSATLSSDRNNTADNTPDSMRECGAANPVAGDISRGVHGEPEAVTATDSKQTRKKKGIWSFFRKGWKAVKGTFSSCHRNKMSPDTVSLEPDPQPADLEHGSSPGPSGLNPTLDVVPVGSETTPAPDTNSLEPASALDPADSEESSVTESYSLALSSVPGSSSLASSSVRGSSDLGSTAEPGPSGLGSVYVPENQSPVSDSKQTRKKKGIWSFFQKGWKAVKGTFCCCNRNKMSPDTVSLEPEPQPADLEHGSSPGPSGLNPTLDVVPVGSETTLAPDTNSLEPASALDPADSEESSVTESYSLALSSVPGSSSLASSSVRGSSDLGSTAEPGPSGLGSVYVPENQSPVSDSKQTRKKKGIWSFFQKGWKAVKGTFCCCYRNKMSPDMVSLEPEPQPADLEHGSSPGPSGLNPTQVGSETTPAPDTKSLEPVSALDPADSEESSVTESYSLALSSVPGSSGLTSSPVQGSSDLGSTAEPGPSGLGSVYVPENQSSVSVGFLKRYEVGEMLGAGVHGIVFSGTRKSDRQKVAIKFITKGYMTSFCHLPGYPELAEVAALLKMKQAPISQNIIQMYEWFEEKNMTILILEFPDPCETLFEFIFRNGDQLTEAVARDLMLQAVLAAAHCLENDVVHGDIHEHNILVNTDTLQLKMIDFGCAVLLEEDVQKPGLEYNSRKKCAIEVTIRHLYGVLYKLVKGPGPHLSREILLERPVFWNMMAGFSLVPVGPGLCELAPLITMMVHN